MPRAERFVASVAALVLGCASPSVTPVSAPLPPPALPVPVATPPQAIVPVRDVASSTPATPKPRGPVSAPAAPPTSANLVEQLLAGGGKTLASVLASPAKYRFQVLYSPVQGGASPKLERYGYRADAEYFFPASSMKVPIALATYERLAVMRSAGHPGLTRNATTRIFPVEGAGEPFVTTLAREVWRAIIVSDNPSANRILGYVGHREAHEALWGLGLRSARIHGGFSSAGDTATLSPRIEVALEGGGTMEMPPRRSDLSLPATDATGLDVGEAKIVDGRREPGPLSFADKNAIRLTDLQDTLVRIMRPELLPPAQSTSSEEDLASLRQALGTLPSESGLAGYERNVVADYQLNPLLRGLERVRARGRFQVFSKVGQAYGFLVANAYVVDKDTGRSFFLTAAIYANPDETMNDDQYAYEAISFPALADVGEVICRHAFGAK